jgi:hypothetical protein
MSHMQSQRGLAQTPGASQQDDGHRARTVALHLLREHPAQETDLPTTAGEVSDVCRELSWRPRPYGI